MPAGLPPGIPGIRLVIDGAVQQAPQPARQASAVSGVVISGRMERSGNAAAGQHFTPLRHREPKRQTANFFLYVNGAADIALL